MSRTPGITAIVLPSLVLLAITGCGGDSSPDKEASRVVLGSGASARLIALLVLRYRTEQNISQTQLAKKLRVSQPALARLEGGEHNPTFETIQKLSQALDLEIAIDFVPEGKNRKLVELMKKNIDERGFEISEASVSVVAI